MTSDGYHQVCELCYIFLTSQNISTGLKGLKVNVQMNGPENVAGIRIERLSSSWSLATIIMTIGLSFMAVPYETILRKRSCCWLLFFNCITLN